MKPKITRRQLLRLSLLSLIGMGVESIRRSTSSIGFANWFRWMWRGQRARLLGPRSPVAIVGCPSYADDVLGAMRQGWRLLGGIEMTGRRVVLKPNLVDYLAGHPAYTHPRVVEAAIRLCREQGAREVILAEGTTFRRDVGPLLRQTGLAEVLEAQRVPFVDLNHDDVVERPLAGGYIRLKSLFVPRTILEADVLISVPKMKTHHWAGVSLSMKNLFGLVPGLKYGWPKNSLHQQGIALCIVELYHSFPCQLAIVDGIVGMEGNGPLVGEAVPSGVLAMGRDAVAVDATCARLMGFDPTHIEHLHLAAWAGLGMLDEGKIEVRGTPLAAAQRSYRPALTL